MIIFILLKFYSFENILIEINFTFIYIWSIFKIFIIEFIKLEKHCSILYAIIDIFINNHIID